LFKAAQCFRSQLWYCFHAKNLVDHLDSVIFKHWHHRNMIKYVPENRSSSMEAIETLKKTIRLKYRTWTSPAVEGSDVDML
jgi:hypothetical protein